MVAAINLDERILILAPVGRDAALAAATLQRAGLAAQICASIEELCQQAAAGAGGLLVTQEALSIQALQRLMGVLQAQPAWSDLPIIVLNGGNAAAPDLGRAMNATFLERPVRAATLLNAARVALRARRRQYELRDLLAARARAEEAERQARVMAEEAVRIRDEFLAAVAHDLKNPLGAIKG